MMHPGASVSFVSPDIGYGVFATAFIPAGTIVYVADPLEIEIAPDDARLGEPALYALIEKYSYIDPRGVRVLSWDVAKYVNHSCRPNTMSTGYGFEIAVRDIHVGDEITDDYGMLNITEPLRCQCGASECRGEVRGDDLDRHATRWDVLLRDALAASVAVPQPLAGFLDDSVREGLRRFVESGDDYPSVAGLRHRPIAPMLEIIAPVRRLRARG